LLSSFALVIMWRTLLSLLIGCWGGGLPWMLAQPDSALRVQPAQSLLWQIDHPLLPHSSFLVAIIHQVPASDFFLPAGTLTLARRTKRLVLAIDPDDPPRDLRYRSDMPLDSSLAYLLPEGEYRSLRRWVEDSLSSLARFKLDTRYPPSVLAREFLGEYCLTSGERELPVLTEYFLRHALEDLPLGVVQTGWSRIAWLDSQPLVAQVRHLMHVWHHRQAQCEVFSAMWRAYQAQDLDKLWLLMPDVPDLGANAGRLIEARNQAWLRYLKLHLPDEPLFMAVLAGQLPGEYGLLHQLRKAGYQVRPWSNLSVASPAER
jgi:hypothetical protein